MDLRHLRTFVSVAEQGTVSKASLRLHVTQPALSRQIHDLEEELGVRLFDRVRRRLLLTGEGEQLLAYCRSVLGAVAALGERADLLRRPDSGVLKVAATPQMIDGVFSGFLHRYTRDHPHIEIKLTEAVGPTLLAMLERGELHIGISLLQAVQADSQAFETFPLPPIEFLAAGSSPIGAGGRVEIGWLASQPLLLLDPTFVVRRAFDAACRLAGIRPNVLLESRTPHTLLALAEAGHGVAVVPSVLPTHRYRLHIVRITRRRRPLREPLAALWDKRRARPRFAEDFCQSLAAYMREVFPISKPPTARRARRSR